MFKISSIVFIFFIGSLMLVENGVLGDVKYPKIGEQHADVQGTYWQGSTFAGACLLQNYQQPPGLKYVAINKDINRDAQYCGTCIKITPKATKLPPVVAIVTSYCDNCPPAALDMEGSLYDALMTNDNGRSGVARFSWEVVECPLGNRKPAIVNKEGSSKWHLSMLIADSKFPIAAVVITSGGKEIPAHKTDYNHWELSTQSTLDDVVDVSVTCTNGGSFSVKKVDPSSRKPTLAESDCSSGQGYTQNNKVSKKKNRKLVNEKI